MDNPSEILIQSRTGKKHYLAALLLLAAIGGLVWFGYHPWKQRQDNLTASAKENGERALLVTAVRAKRSPGSLELALPGTASPIYETSIYARAEGYVKARHADIGDRVKTDQLLVEIDTPELDDQLRQAVARLAQARAAIGQSKAAIAQSQANLKLAELNVGRSRELVRQGIVSKQDGDDKQATYEVRLADVEAQKAALNSAEASARAAESEVARLTNLTAFKKVSAPFDGVITSRTCEVGNLINSSALASGRELYRLADIATVRFLINVPEPSAPAIQPGQTAQVTLQEFGNQIFAGKVARTANSLDAANRTLLTEVHVPNPQRKLLPGMYAQVKIVAGRGGPALTIPGDTVTVRSDGTYVAVIKPDSTIHFQKITVGRDYGAELELTEGLEGGELLVVNPGDSVREGVKVTPAMQKEK
jgi:RND family efflux transporter MFP subunit